MAQEDSIHASPASNKRTSVASDWKEFERLVEWVEKALVGTNATVVRQARITGKTKAKREVDVLVKIPYSGGDLILLLECRARKETSDTTWIEQLSGKRHRLKAAKVIAISSKPFSPEAVSAAEDFGIELRLFSDVHPDRVLQLISAIKITITSWHLTNMELTFDIDKEAVAPFLIEGKLDVVINETEPWILLNGLEHEGVRATDMALGGFLEQVERENDSTMDLVIEACSSEGKSLHIKTGGQQIPIKGIRISAHFDKAITPLLNVMAGDYCIENSDGRMVLRHEHTINGARFATLLLTNDTLSAIYSCELEAEQIEEFSLPQLVTCQVRLEMTAHSLPPIERRSVVTSTSKNSTAR